MSDPDVARSAYGLFCEDIRHEQAAQVSLVGVFPARIRVQTFPFNFPKFVVYTVINIPIAEPPKKILVEVTATWSSEPLLRFDIDAEVQEANVGAAPEANLPDAKMFEMRFSPTMFGLEVPKPGRVTGVIRIDDQPFPPFVLRIDGADAPPVPQPFHTQVRPQKS